MSELRKAKSPGLVSSVNAAGLGAAVTRRRFHAPAAAFIHPARSPTPRSGLGAVGDMSNFVAGAPAGPAAAHASKTGLGSPWGCVGGVGGGQHECWASRRGSLAS